MNWVMSWKVKSHSSDREYTVSVDEGGNWGCSCWAWKGTSPRRDCKHILEMKRKMGVK
jgi:hypothetical protein